MAYYSIVRRFIRVLTRLIFICSVCVKKVNKIVNTQSLKIGMDKTYFFRSWSLDRMRLMKAAPLFLRKFSYGSFICMPTPLYRLCRSRTSPPDMGASMPWPCAPKPVPLPPHPIFIRSWWPLLLSSMKSFAVFDAKLLSRWNCLCLQSKYRTIWRAYPKLGGGERDRSRRSLSRSFFECFGGFGLLHTGVEIVRFGDSEYDLDRDFDLDFGRGDFERLLLLVRDLEKRMSTNWLHILRFKWFTSQLTDTIVSLSVSVWPLRWRSAMATESVLVRLAVFPLPWSS